MMAAMDHSSELSESELAWRGQVEGAIAVLEMSVAALARLSGHEDRLAAALEGALDDTEEGPNPHFTAGLRRAMERIAEKLHAFGEEVQAP